MVKRDALVRAILRKTGQRRRSGDTERPYLTRKELLQVSGYLDVVKERLGGKGNGTRGK